MLDGNEGISFWVYFVSGHFQDRAAGLVPYIFLGCGQLTLGDGPLAAPHQLAEAGIV